MQIENDEGQWTSGKTFITRLSCGEWEEKVNENLKGNEFPTFARGRTGRKWSENFPGDEWWEKGAINCGRCLVSYPLAWRNARRNCQLSKDLKLRKPKVKNNPHRVKAVKTIRGAINSEFKSFLLANFYLFWRSYPDKIIEKDKVFLNLLGNGTFPIIYLN